MILTPEDYESTCLRAGECGGIPLVFGVPHKCVTGMWEQDVFVIGGKWVGIDAGECISVSTGLTEAVGIPEGFLEGKQCLFRAMAADKVRTASWEVDAAASELRMQSLTGRVVIIGGQPRGVRSSRARCQVHLP